MCMQQYLWHEELHNADTHQFASRLSEHWKHIQQQEMTISAEGRGYLWHEELHGAGTQQGIQ